MFLRFDCSVASTFAPPQYTHLRTVTACARQNYRAARYPFASSFG